MQQQKEVFRELMDPLFSRVGKTAMIETEKRLFHSSRASPRHGRNSGPSQQDFATILPSDSGGKKRGRRNLGVSFRAASREQDKKPCVGQYMLNYGSITRYNAQLL